MVKDSTQQESNFGSKNELPSELYLEYFPNAFGYSGCKLEVDPRVCLANCKGHVLGLNAFTGTESSCLHSSGSGWPLSARSGCRSTTLALTMLAK